MLLDRGPSWWQRSWPRAINQVQIFGEQGSWYGGLCHLNGVVAAVAHNVRADLGQLLLQLCQGTLLDLLR